MPRPTKRVQLTLKQSNNQLIQLNIKDRLKAFGDKGDEAILKEIIQLQTHQAIMQLYYATKKIRQYSRKLRKLHMWQALMPQNKEEISDDERRQSLHFLMFQTNLDGSINAWGCADGWPQMLYTDKEGINSLHTCQALMPRNKEEM
jgi:hypothetical protein